MSTILYLSYDGMTDPLGRSQVLPYLTGLTQKGYQFHLVSFEKQERFRQHGEAVLELTRRSGIVWHPIPYTKRPPVLSTVFDLFQMERKALELIRKFGIETVHCRSYISGLVGLRLKRKLNTRFVFDIRGFWADERVEGGLWNLNNPLYAAVYRFFKNKEREMFIHADAIVSLTARAARLITEQFHVDVTRLHVIPCCADLALFDRNRVSDAVVEKIKQLTNLKDQGPVLGYLGAIGTWYMLEEMLVFFKKLLQSKPNSFFLFITTEPKETILEQAQRMGIPTSKVGIYAATREEVPSALSLFDVSVFFIRPTYSKAASSPTKQGEIMGMGIPLICNTGIGDTDAIVEQYKCGRLVDLEIPSSMDQVISHIDEIMEIPETRIRSGAEEAFSLEQGVKRYQQLYRSIGLD